MFGCTLPPNGHSREPRCPTQISSPSKLMSIAPSRASRPCLVDGEFGGTEVDSAIVRAELEIRLRSLSEQRGPLTGGRIDETNGPRHYIGRRHVKDRNDEPVVVDWRAPVAAPFYRATISVGKSEPLQGLCLKQRSFGPTRGNHS